MNPRLFSRLSFVLTSLLFVMLSFQQANAEEKYDSTISIIQGQTRLMPFPHVTRVSIGHSDIANAQATGPDEILLTGLKAGSEAATSTWAGLILSRSTISAPAAIASRICSTESTSTSTR